MAQNGDCDKAPCRVKGNIEVDSLLGQESWRRRESYRIRAVLTKLDSAESWVSLRYSRGAASISALL